MTTTLENLLPQLEPMKRAQRHAVEVGEVPMPQAEAYLDNELLGTLFLGSGMPEHDHEKAFQQVLAFLSVVYPIDCAVFGTDSWYAEFGDITKEQMLAGMRPSDMAKPKEALAYYVQLPETMATVHLPYTRTKASGIVWQEEKVQDWSDNPDVTREGIVPTYLAAGVKGPSSEVTWTEKAILLLTLGGLGNAFYMPKRFFKELRAHVPDNLGRELDNQFELADTEDFLRSIFDREEE